MVRKNIGNWWMSRKSWAAVAASVAVSCSPGDANEFIAVETSPVTISGCGLADGRTWCGTDVGNTPASASFDFDPTTKTFTVSASAPTRGAGDDNDGGDNSDEMRFINTAITGNVEIIARLKSFQGSPGANVGVTIRADTSRRAAAGVGMLDVFGCDNCVPDGHEFTALWRPTANTQSGRGRSATDSIPQQAPPVAGQLWNLPVGKEPWFRLRRVGNDFAVSRSETGTHWLPLFSVSGGEFSPTQAILGFFVSAGNVSGATATFDNVSVREFTNPPPFADRTSWVGGNFSRMSTGFVHGATNGLYVDRNGRAYTSSESTETAHEIDVLSNGVPMKLLDHGLKDWLSPVAGSGILQNGVSGDPTDPNHVYYGRKEVTGTGTRYCIARREWNATQNALIPTPALTSGCPLPEPGQAELGPIAGFAVRNGEIYVSDLKDVATSSDDVISVLSATTLMKVREFPFQRPSAIAVDNFGKLWIIQSAIDYPRSAANSYELKYTPSVKCYSRTGVACTNITDPSIKNPVALAIDPRATVHRLAIADNGGGANNDGTGGQNIRIFTNLNGTPTAEPAFGAPGGVYSGTRGAIIDNASGASRRFYDLIGVGIDNSGNIYVASGNDNLDVRSYTSAGALNWAIYANHDHVDFDPQTDDIFTATRHFAFDPTPTAAPGPGTNLSGFKNVTWDPYRYAEKEQGKVGRKRGYPVVQRIDSKRFMYVLGDSWEPPPQATQQARRSTGFQKLAIYRFDTNDMAIPCGELSFEMVCVKPTGDECGNQPQSQCLCNVDPDPGSVDAMRYGTFWADSNGNGVKDSVDGFTEWATINPFECPGGECNVSETGGAPPTPAELANPRPPQDMNVFDVDTNGDLWLTFSKELWQLKFQGFVGTTGGQCPLYRGNHDPNSRTGPTSLRAIHRDFPLFNLPQYAGGTRAALLEAHFDPANHAMYLASGIDMPPSTGIRQVGVVSRFDWERDTGKGDCASPGECYEKPAGDPRFPKVPTRSCPCGGCPLVNGACTQSCWCNDPLGCPVAGNSAYSSDFMFGADDPTACGDADSNYTWEGYHGFDIAGDKLFLHETWGPVHVLEASTGQEVARLYAGPEASGFQAFSAGFNRMRAHRRSDGEYLVAVNDDTQFGRTLLLRWKPTPVLGEPGDDCTLPAHCASGFCEQGVCCETSCASSFCQGASCNGPIPGQCFRTNLQDGTTCNDGNACTQSDRCQTGVCAGTSNPAGSENFCSSACRCAHGGGDCDPGTPSQCLSGLTCINDVGAAFGMSSTTDVCLPSSCTAPRGSESFCSATCRCGYGGGDCDPGTPSQCMSGLTCINDVGAGFGMSATTDVCLPSACGANAYGSANFCSAACPCGRGGGDCEPGTPSQCMPGLVCGTDNGAAFGLPATTDVCVPG